jgi:hypothetical protein
MIRSAPAKRSAQPLASRPATALAWIGSLGLLVTLIPRVATSHSASDAYLTLTTVSPMAGRFVVHGQWDIALRDLDFVLKLDDDGDGRVTWGEVRNHGAAIENYAYRHIQASGGQGNHCSIEPRRRMIDDHADGAYAALFFDVVCAHVPRKISLRYTLFFNIDPSHRGIFVMNSGHDVATALLSPQNSKIDVAVTRSAE